MLKTNPNPTNEASQTILGFVKILGKVEGKEDRNENATKKQLNFSLVVSKMFFFQIFTSNPSGKMISKNLTCAKMFAVIRVAAKAPTARMGTPQPFHGFRGWLSY